MASMLIWVLALAGSVAAVCLTVAFDNHSAHMSATALATFGIVAAAVSDHRAGEVFLDVGIHALDHRHHHHEERNGDDNPEQREEGAQLGGPDGAERNAEGLEKGHVGAGKVNGKR